jgi:superfamily I DNA and/or RNA helicase
MQEALVTQSLVKSLLALPQISAANILVLTGYRRQLKLLEELAKRNTWDGVAIKTVDSWHGTEQQIVILTTVRTFGGGAGFMANKSRANGHLQGEGGNVFCWQVAILRAGTVIVLVLRAVVQSMRQRLPGFVVDATPS